MILKPFYTKAEGVRHLVPVSEWSSTSLVSPTFLLIPIFDELASPVNVAHSLNCKRERLTATGPQISDLRKKFVQVQFIRPLQAINESSWLTESLWGRHLNRDLDSLWKLTNPYTQIEKLRCVKRVGSIV